MRDIHLFKEMTALLLMLKKLPEEFISEDLASLVFLEKEAAEFAINRAREI